MNKISVALLASALLGSTPAFAASPWDGTWKGDPAGATIEAKPDEFSIKNGTYSCKTCLPAAYSVKADGAFHAVKDKPYWDEVAIKVVDDHTVDYQYRKGGKVVAENVSTVSADGNTLTDKSTNTNNAAGAKIDFSRASMRVGSPIAGAHLVSGAWKQDQKSTTASENALTMTIKVDGDKLHLTSPLGETLDAKIGGDYAANVGDPGKTMTKAEAPSANVLKLTDMRDGKIVQVSTYTLAADGKTMEAAWMDPRDGSKGHATVTKQ